MSKPLSRYRTFVAVTGRDVAVTYATTCIVRADDATVTLNSGGWRTVTTKRKMTQAAEEFGLGFSVFQKAGAWYVCRFGRTAEGYASASRADGAIVLPYRDGMQFPRGTARPGTLHTFAA